MWHYSSAINAVQLFCKRNVYLIDKWYAKASFRSLLEKYSNMHIYVI